MTSTTTILLVLAVLIYFIVRQFTEQAVKPLFLILFPLLVIYANYNDISKELSNPLMNVTLVASMVSVGLLLGAAIGWYRGGLTRMRLDSPTQTVFVKATAWSLSLWLVLLIIKIAVGVVLYTGWMHTSLPVLYLLAFASPLFLGNVIAEKARIFWRATHYQATVTSSL